MKGVERLCRVETSGEVNGTLVTVPLRLVRHDMVALYQTAGAGPRYPDVWGLPQRQCDDLRREKLDTFAVS